jgi:hypothetical protein
MLKLLEDMHMTHEKSVCCCHALDEVACKVWGRDSKSKLAFEATTQADTMVCVHVPSERGDKYVFVVTT